MNVFAPELDRPKPARVEIIPLIDVVFFLLATFVLFTLSLHRLRSVEARFAEANNGGPTEGETVFIQAVAGDTYLWKVGAEGEAEPMTAPELGLRLEDLRRRTADPRVMVRSDGKARLGAVVLVLDEVRRAGIRQVAVETMASRPGT